MTLDTFKASLGDGQPPPDLIAPLAAMWLAGRGEGGWGRAHDVVQDAAGADAAWVHAYLHRVEGDLSNSSYWYRQAGRPAAEGQFPAEWDAIVTALLAAPED